MANYEKSLITYRIIKSSLLPLILILTTHIASGPNLCNAQLVLNETLLIQSILNGYEIRSRPVVDVTNSVAIELSMNMEQLHEIDTRLQHISIIGWMTATWNDPRLTWNTSDYGGLDYITVLPTDVWVPTFVLGNTAAQQLYSQEWYSLYKVQVYYDGTMIWKPGGTIEANCQIHVRYFPFDDQICHFRFATWVYGVDKVNLTYGADAEDGFLDYYNNANGEWDVKGVKVVRGEKYYSDAAGAVPYPEVYFGMLLTRKPLFYVMNIVLMSFLLAGLVLIMFWLPPESGERVSMGVTLLLAFSVFVLMLDTSIPETSSSVPLIIVYLFLFMTLTTFGIAESVLILYCYHHIGDKRPPKWLRIVAFQAVGKCLCDNKITDMDRKFDAKQDENHEQLTRGDKKELKNGNVIVVTSIPSKNQTDDVPLSEQDIKDLNIAEWRHLSILFDKFCFWLFLAMFLLLILVLLIILPLSKTSRDLEIIADWAGF